MRSNEGLNVVENWNATNDFICYGRQGELATNSREQQEIVTLTLQLLQNCLMLINTILVERTIEREGLWERLSAEDLRALPLSSKSLITSPAPATISLFSFIGAFPPDAEKRGLPGWDRAAIRTPPMNAVPENVSRCPGPS